MRQDSSYTHVFYEAPHTGTLECTAQPGGVIAAVISSKIYGEWTTCEA